MRIRTRSGEGHLMFLAAMIKQAVWDYKYINPKGGNYQIYNSAKNFIFNDDWLAKLLDKCGVDWDVEYIRRMANDENVVLKETLVGLEKEE